MANVQLRSALLAIGETASLDKVGELSENEVYGDAYYRMQAELMQKGVGVLCDVFGQAEVKRKLGKLILPGDDPWIDHATAKTHQAFRKAAMADLKYPRPDRQSPTRKVSP